MSLRTLILGGKHRTTHVLYEQGKLISKKRSSMPPPRAPTSGFAVGSTRRGKGTKIVAVAASNTLPLAVSVKSAAPAECKLVEVVLAGSFLDELPIRADSLY